ncbi:MAG TPA: hypothetical protein VJ720_01505, partial [Chitinophaga sp.]|nr:hypothetical protein [Chitinophaga sp.]
MKRALQLVTLLLAGYTGMAQDLAYKIPEKARMVASFRADQLFRLYPAAEFDTSAMGRELLGKISKKSSADFKSIEDLGLDLKGTIYYYSQHTDSINYNCVLIPIKDAGKVEKLFTEDERAAFTRQNGVTALQTAVNKPLVAWNNEILVVTYGTLNKYFLEDS